ncbi:hypothetical protein DK095_650005 [Flavobacterium psychrophilum]|nr:hypothetical protein DK095_650005 [Flavobacterium psychrophilum]SNB18607.1 hypothetical protein JIP1600_310002 [Flavobacterium psychrophilum]
MCFSSFYELFNITAIKLVLDDNINAKKTLFRKILQSINIIPLNFFNNASFFVNSHHKYGVKQ